MNIKYTNTDHKARKTLGVTPAEYMIVDAIFFKQNDPDSKKEGWCTVPRPEMADFFDMTTRGLQALIKRMIDKGLLKRNSKGYLKTTKTWYLAVHHLEGGEKSSWRGEKSSPLGVKKVHEKGEKSSPPYNKETISNNNINTNNNDEFFFENDEGEDVPYFVKQNRSLLLHNPEQPKNLKFDSFPALLKLISEIKSNYPAATEQYLKTPENNPRIKEFFEYHAHEPKWADLAALKNHLLRFLKKPVSAHKNEESNTYQLPKNAVF